MKYLLDTCLISELVKPRPDKSVIKWLNTSNEEDLFLRVITIGEIQKEITKVNDKTKKAKLENWLNHDLMEQLLYGERYRENQKSPGISFRQLIV